jgi:hypothetical protein
MAMSSSSPPPASLLNRAGAWPLRLLWLILPVAAGATFADALDPSLRSFRTVTSVGLWVVWGVTLIATLIPRTVTLTPVRLVVPASLPAVAWAASASPFGVEDIAALLTAGLAAIASLAPSTGDAFVNGSSYGDERRLPLRPPGTLLLGPIELAWLAAVAGLTSGPLLLAAQHWVAGGIATAIGLPVAALAVRALHGLSQRWVVFVPAGLVVHDHLALADPVLLARRSIVRLGPAPADTDARDLTVGALGLALEARLREPVPLVLARLAAAGAEPPGGDGEADEAGRATTTDPLLFTPSQPGEVLREARRRRFAVG